MIYGLQGEKRHRELPVHQYVSLSLLINALTIIGVGVCVCVVALLDMLGVVAANNTQPVMLKLQRCVCMLSSPHVYYVCEFSFSTVLLTVSPCEGVHSCFFERHYVGVSLHCGTLIIKPW